MKRRLRANLSAPIIIRRILVSWLIAATITYCVLPSHLQSLADLEGIRQMWLPGTGMISFVFFVFLCALGCYKNSCVFERVLFVVTFAILAGISLKNNFSLPYFSLCLFILVFLVVYGVKGWNSTKPSLFSKQTDSPTFLYIVGLITLLFVIFVSLWTVLRVQSFRTPTYDFGIFSQMFYNMKASGLPMTTVERDGLLSHFHVHVSPIYYLLLPFYWLIPTPATLQVLQAIVLASAVIPLWKLSRNHGLAPLSCSLICILLMVTPAYAGGTSYDIHENAFLTPLILWLFFAIERKNTFLTVLFTILTLTVKEDAAVYVAVIAIYVLCNALLHNNQDKTWSVLTGIGMLAGAIIWFACTTGFLAAQGDGVMTYRYQNFIYDDSNSLVTVIKTVLLSPMKALYECVDREKLPYISLTLFPLLGLPFITRRYERLILLIPYVLINLMSDYQYQHSIFFQYNFGSLACLFYLTVVNLADWNGDWKKVVALIAAVIVSVSCFVDTVLPKASFYIRDYQKNKTQYEQIYNVLALIPEDTTVSASTFYTTALSQREVLYDVKYAAAENILRTQYVVLQPNSTTSYSKYADDSGENGYENFKAFLESNNYVLWESLTDQVAIYKKTT